jgi:Domain of unknown function (DUF2017)
VFRRLMRRRPVGRAGDGYVLRLGEDEAALLASLADQLEGQLDDPTADSTLRRLFPPARTDDLLAEAAWQIEQGEALRRSRRGALDALRHPVGEPLDEDGLVAWMQGLNSLRLVLGERLEVSEEPDADESDVRAAAALLGSDDPDQAEWARQRLGAWELYHYLSYLVDSAVRALGDPA